MRFSSVRKVILTRIKFNPELILCLVDEKSGRKEKSGREKMDLYVVFGGKEKRSFLRENYGVKVRVLIFKPR